MQHRRLLASRNALHAPAASLALSAGAPEIGALSRHVVPAGITEQIIVVSGHDPESPTFDAVGAAYVFQWEPPERNGPFGLNPSRGDLVAVKSKVKA